MANGLFKADAPLGAAIHEFWHSLNDDRQTRAQLRRADDLTALVMVPGVHRLLYRMQAAAKEQGQDKLSLHSDHGRLRVAVIAGALAHIEAHKPIQDKYRYSTAFLMSRHKKESDTTCVSELRFRRLLQASDLEEFYPMLRRTLALINHEADVYVLANDIWFWGDKLRRQWAYDYYAVSA